MLFLVVDLESEIQGDRLLQCVIDFNSSNKIMGRPIPTYLKISQHRLLYYARAVICHLENRRMLLLLIYLLPPSFQVDHTRILDFDIKRRYFRTELDRMDAGIKREDLAVHVHVRR